MVAQHRATLSLEHRIAIGATMIGISRDQYRRHVEAGLKWCPTHRDWHPRTTEFWYRRPTTADGLDSMCKETVRARAREGMRRVYARRRAARAAS